jgi:hypothetical protein
MNNYSWSVEYKKDKQSELSSLSEKYGSDKGFINYENTILPWGYHSYTDFYEMLFDHCKDNILNVFECGIGTNNESFESNMTTNGSPGASLRMWRDYFKNAQIFGADIDAGILFEEERIKTYHLDQTNTESIKNIWSQIKTDFDVFIDDGLHHFFAGKILFENSIQKVKTGGVYIIEDVWVDDVNLYKEYFNSINTPCTVIRLLGDKMQKDNSLILIRKR